MVGLVLCPPCGGMVGWAFALKTNLGVAALLSASVFLTSHLPSAHADTVTIFGTAGTNGVAGPPATDGGPGGSATEKEGKTERQKIRTCLLRPAGPQRAQTA